MGPKDGKNAYDALLADAKKLTEDTDVPAEGSFSLEEILAEYGQSRQQKLMADVDRETAQPEEPQQPEKPEPDQAAPADGTSAGPAEREPEDLPSAKGGASPETSNPQEKQLEAVPENLPRAPHPISMEEVVGTTVDAVMEEQELLPEKKRRRGLFSRRRFVETEELYQRPETPPREPEKAEPKIVEPERPLGEAAAECREDAKRLGKPLTAAMLVTLLLAALMTLNEEEIAVPLWTGDVPVQTGVLLAALLSVCILCRSVFARGFRTLARKRCCGELLISFSAAVAAADCVTRPFLEGRSDAMPYAVAACAALVFAQWGGQRRSRALYDTYRTAAMSEPLYLVTDTPDGACKQAGRIEGFYTDTGKDDLPLLWQTALLPVVLVGSVTFAVLASVGQGRPQNFLLCWSAILSAGASFALPLCWSLPWSRLAHQLQKSGGAVAGWAGAEAVSRKKAMILTDMDLFPPGTIRLNGIKVFGEELPHAVSYAASLVRASGSGLEQLFDGLVRSECGQYYEPDDFSFYEEGGCSANLCGESVLLGTASFMRKMDVRLPGNMNLRTGVFLAVEHQLTAMFAVKYSAAENVDWALRMVRHNHITPILASRDANITPTLLKRKFNKGVKVEYPSLAARLALSEQADGRGLPRAILLREGLLPYAEAVTGSRRLVRAARRCSAVTLLGSAAGTLLAFYLTFLDSFFLMTPMTLLLFLLLWTLPVLLLSGWSGRF